MTTKQSGIQLRIENWPFIKVQTLSAQSLPLNY